MCNRNQDAEDIMQRIEKEEDKVLVNDSTKMTFHLCTVNLVIGTLYCTKGNYEFGITRIMKSLVPFDKKVINHLKNKIDSNFF